MRKRLSSWFSWLFGKREETVAPRVKAGDHDIRCPHCGILIWEGNIERQRAGETVKPIKNKLEEASGPLWPYKIHEPYFTPPEDAPAEKGNVFKPEPVILTDEERERGFSLLYGRIDHENREANKPRRENFNIWKETIEAGKPQKREFDDLGEYWKAVEKWSDERHEKIVKANRSGCITFRTSEEHIEYYPGGTSATPEEHYLANKPGRGASATLGHYWAAVEKWREERNANGWRRWFEGRENGGLNVFGHKQLLPNGDIIHIPEIPQYRRKNGRVECQCVTCKSLRESGTIKRPEGYQGNLGGLPPGEPPSITSIPRLKERKRGGEWAGPKGQAYPNGAITIKTVAAVFGLFLAFASVVGIIFAAEARLNQGPGLAALSAEVTSNTNRFDLKLLQQQKSYLQREIRALLREYDGKEELMPEAVWNQYQKMLNDLADVEKQIDKLLPRRG